MSGLENGDILLFQQRRPKRRKRQEVPFCGRRRPRFPSKHPNRIASAFQGLMRRKTAAAARPVSVTAVSPCPCGARSRRALRPGRRRRDRRRSAAVAGAPREAGDATACTYARMGLSAWQEENRRALIGGLDMTVAQPPPAGAEKNTGGGACATTPGKNRRMPRVRRTPKTTGGSRRGCRRRLRAVSSRLPSGFR